MVDVTQELCSQLEPSTVAPKHSSPPLTKASISTPHKPQKHHKMLLDKQKAVGCNQGVLFDSGCNWSGVRNIHIHLGDLDRFPKHLDNYASSIKRIYFEFDTPTQRRERLSPSYEAHATFYFEGLKNTTRVFEVDPGDAVTEIAVWSDRWSVNAIQFHTASGLISELYGVPRDASRPPTIFRGRDTGFELVGVHGLYRGAISKLGFTFAAKQPAEGDFEESLLSAERVPDVTESASGIVKGGDTEPEEEVLLVENVWCDSEVEEDDSSWDKQFE